MKYQPNYTGEAVVVWQLKITSDVSIFLLLSKTKETSLKKQNKKQQLFFETSVWIQLEFSSLMSGKWTEETLGDADDYFSWIIKFYLLFCQTEMLENYQNIHHDYPEFANHCVEIKQEIGKLINKLSHSDLFIVC